MLFNITYKKNIQVFEFLIRALSFDKSHDMFIFFILHVAPYINPQNLKIRYASVNGLPNSYEAIKWASMKGAGALNPFTYWFVMKSATEVFKLPRKEKTTRYFTAFLFLVKKNLPKLIWGPYYIIDWFF